MGHERIGFLPRYNNGYDNKFDYLTLPSIGSSTPFHAAGLSPSRYSIALA